MPFLIRSKGFFLKVRDGCGLDAPVRELRPGVWVRFHNCPKGIKPPGDHQQEVREIVAESGAAEMIASLEVGSVIDDGESLAAKPEKIRRRRRVKK